MAFFKGSASEGRETVGAHHARIQHQLHLNVGEDDKQQRKRNSEDLQDLHHHPEGPHEHRERRVLQRSGDATQLHDRRKRDD